MPTFQILSDIHLELCSQYSTFEIPPVAPNLILAGDVGNLAQYPRYLSFLQKQCANFERVFLVLGNHEFYGMTHEEGIESAEKLMQEEGCRGKLFVLNRGRYDFGVLSSPLEPASVITADTQHDTAEASTQATSEAETTIQENAGDKDNEDDDDNVTVLGCTLHSYICPQNELITRMKVHDFSRIHDWTTTSHNAEHALDVSWLRSQIHAIKSTHPTRRILVVTHHAPFRQGSSKPEYIKHPWSDGFATELLDIDREEEVELDVDEVKHSDKDKDNNKDNEAKKGTKATKTTRDMHGTKNVSRVNVYRGTGPHDELRQVHTWLFGHTHYSTTTTRGTVRCIANQRGYVFPPPPPEPPLAQPALEPDPEPDTQPKTDQPQSRSRSRSRLSRIVGNIPLLNTILPSRSDNFQGKKTGRKSKESNENKTSSFRIIYRDLSESDGQRGGHEGDGLVPFNVERCVFV